MLSNAAQHFNRFHVISVVTAQKVVETGTGCKETSFQILQELFSKSNMRQI
jgi:hypothetical protein